MSALITGWLLAGLVVLRNAIPELAEHATRLIEGQDFRLFYDRKLRQVWHGYWVHEKHPSIFHYGTHTVPEAKAYLAARGVPGGQTA